MVGSSAQKAGSFPLAIKGRLSVPQMPIKHKRFLPVDNGGVLSTI
jgi:hypothetical protein